MWKYDHLSEWVIAPPRIRNVRSGSSKSSNLTFSTLSHVEFQVIREAFYAAGKKRVPAALDLSPFALAVWFMDDGSKKSKRCRGVYFNTQSFDSESIEILRNKLSDRFEVDSTIRMQKDGMQIYIPSRSIRRLVDLLEPFVIPCMRYKLPN